MTAWAIKCEAKCQTREDAPDHLRSLYLSRTKEEGFLTMAKPSMHQPRMLRAARNRQHRMPKDTDPQLVFNR
jgi:hypothetical protein